MTLEGREEGTQLTNLSKLKDLVDTITISTDHESLPDLVVSSNTRSYTTVLARSTASQLIASVCIHRHC